MQWMSWPLASMERSFLPGEQEKELAPCLHPVITEILKLPSGGGGAE